MKKIFGFAMLIMMASIMTVACNNKTNTTPAGKDTDKE